MLPLQNPWMVSRAVKKLLPVLVGVAVPAGSDDGSTGNMGMERNNCLWHGTWWGGGCPSPSPLPFWGWRLLPHTAREGDDKAVKTMLEMRLLFQSSFEMLPPPRKLLRFAWQEALPVPRAEPAPVSHMVSSGFRRRRALLVLFCASAAPQRIA